ncbi:very short patch repair endonuclease [Parendozoicomonas haliclonae]|uniref:Very short patch repair protein n=1 Tax=Parendozoicomonas haliclonae TaxID=1960125 RepID=A0A1X7AHL6_9GAMM|nr:DNA mismatch endonuclease Vsr [Parendozoicomonas haliclonae]SMA41724.1 Very short patch repair protein [Parendozoicomonas haliclonae]
MVDTLDKAARSRNMSRIRGKNTKPELIVRKFLHSRGVRFRLHGKALCGKPDIILRKYRAVIFVHGCFWHRHENCRLAYTPNSRIDFWAKKFEMNQERDKRVHSTLKKDGWRVLTIWECALRSKDIELHLSEAYHWIISTIPEKVIEDIGLGYDKRLPRSNVDDIHNSEGV